MPVAKRSHVARLYHRIYSVIRRIPARSVATYGQVAELAGLPGGARVVAAALKVAGSDSDLPWHRVIGKAAGPRGRIAIRDPIGAAVQRQLLSKEGVRIADTGLIALDAYGWMPRASLRASPKPSSRTSPRQV